jgi:hypothetical protein
MGTDRRPELEFCGIIAGFKKADRNAGQSQYHRGNR